MAKTILALGASSSRNSINKQLATYAAGQAEGATVNLIDLNDYEMPIYSIDREKENGIPALAHQFKDHIRAADGILISFAEHNGAYSAAYKNIYDWVSRIERSVWLDKPMFLLATSPGGRGGIGVLDIAHKSYSFSNKNTVSRFSLPSFNQNFSSEEGILDATLEQEFNNQLQQFTDAL